MLQEFNKNVPGPKTHVLLIGVGGYPYLKGGTDPRPQTEDFKDLGQLTSPIASVSRFYEKAIEYNTADVWSKKLGSIEMLLSPPPNSPPIPQGVTVTNATLANIQQSYFAWKSRCNEDEENVAIFYYCGHGFQKINHFLLAEDFGEKPQNPWLGAFDFDSTRNAFYSCKANTPIFFVDACRQVTIEMLQYNLAVAPIENPSLLNPEESKNHLTLKATASGLGAYGMANEPSYFAQAVLSGLDGLVARKDQNDDWIIETGELGNNIHKLLDLINPDQSYKQRCQTHVGLPASIIKRTETPNAWFEVSCVPEAALPLAELTCIEDTIVEPVTRTRIPTAGKWKLNVKASTYNLTASFTAGTNYHGSTKKYSLIPPSQKVNFNC